MHVYGMYLDLGVRDVVNQHKHFAPHHLRCYHSLSQHAGVAERQTRMVQVHVGATP
jgi:hypothetical protein